MISGPSVLVFRRGMSSFVRGVAQTTLSPGRRTPRVLLSSAHSVCFSKHSQHHHSSAATPIRMISSGPRIPSSSLLVLQKQLGAVSHFSSQIPPPRKGGSRMMAQGAGLLGAASLLFGKTKYVLAALKLTKLASLGSMVVSIGAYSMFFGLPYACGMVGLITVHEAGHAYVMHLRGMPFSPMVFLPFSKLECWLWLAMFYSTVAWHDLTFFGLLGFAFRVIPPLSGCRDRHQKFAPRCLGRCLDRGGRTRGGFARRGCRSGSGARDRIPTPVCTGRFWFHDQFIQSSSHWINGWREMGRCPIKICGSGWGRPRRNDRVSRSCRQSVVLYHFVGGIVRDLSKVLQSAPHTSQLLRHHQCATTDIDSFVFRLDCGAVDGNGSKSTASQVTRATDS